MAAAQAGDRAAMDVLLRRHAERFYAICRRIAGNDADAADANQEALLAVVRGINRFDGRAKFTTWAHRVVTNACLDELRRRGRRPTPGLPDDDDETNTATLDPAPGVEDRVSERLSMDEALATLPEEFRVPLVLRDVVGHDYAEIAEMLDIPGGTVRSRIARARGKLADLLGNQTDGDERPIATADRADPAPTDREAP